jgi:hypothetical protein
MDRERAAADRAEQDRRQRELGHDTGRARRSWAVPVCERIARDLRVDRLRCTASVRRPETGGAMTDSAESHQRLTPQRSPVHGNYKPPWLWNPVVAVALANTFRPELATRTSLSAGCSRIRSRCGRTCFCRFQGTDKCAAAEARMCVGASNDSCKSTGVAGLRGAREANSTSREGYSF